MSWLAWAMALTLFANSAGAQRPKPGVPDIPAMQALWTALKAALTGPDAQRYWEEQLKDTELPYLHGTVLSSAPKDQPRVLVLAISDKSTPEVTLRIEPGYLKEPVADGTKILFEGAARAFSKRPFRLTVVTNDAVRVHQPKR